MAARVEIIDDDEAVRDSTRAMLEAYGFDVRAHASADDFLQARQFDAHCLLVDYHMPGMTGLELVPELRARGSNAPVLLITGKGDHVIAARAAALGVPILHKPVEVDELINWVEQAIGSGWPKNN